MIKNHLKKMKMPKKASKYSDEDMEMELSQLEDDGENMEEDMEDLEEMDMSEMGPEDESQNPMAKISDEELLAEIKKRGFAPEDLEEMAEGEEDEMKLEG